MLAAALRVIYYLLPIYKNQIWVLLCYIPEYPNKEFIRKYWSYSENLSKSHPKRKLCWNVWARKPILQKISKIYQIWVNIWIRFFPLNPTSDKHALGKRQKLKSTRNEKYLTYKDKWTITIRKRTSTGAGVSLIIEPVIANFGQCD